MVLGPHGRASAPCCCDPGCSCSTWVAHERREATVYLHMLGPAKACLGWVFICTLSGEQGRFLAYLVRHSGQWAADQEPSRPQQLSALTSASSVLVCSQDALAAPTLQVDTTFTQSLLSAPHPRGGVSSWALHILGRAALNSTPTPGAPFCASQNEAVLLPLSFFFIDVSGAKVCLKQVSLCSRGWQSPCPPKLELHLCAVHLS